MPKFTKAHMAALVERYMRYDSGEAIARFEALVREGVAPFLAAMHATRSYPGVVGTDTQFRQSNHSRLENTPDIIRRELKKRRGYSGNAVYHTQLGEWVESVSDIKRVAERKNKTVEMDDGKVLAQGRHIPRVRPPLAENIVRSRMLSYAITDPSLASTPGRIKKLREDVINKHTPPWRRKGKIIE